MSQGAEPGEPTPCCREQGGSCEAVNASAATHLVCMPSRAQCGEVASGVTVASLCTHSGALYSFPHPSTSNGKDT